eukprot:COSAG01_NODE_94_length_26962_cov_9.110933_28_plen_83_part_00
MTQPSGQSTGALASACHAEASTQRRGAAAPRHNIIRLLHMFAAKRTLLPHVEKGCRPRHLMTNTHTHHIDAMLTLPVPRLSS